MLVTNSANSNTSKNKRNKSYLLFFSLVIIFVTCVEPFNPDIDKYESSMVIVGEIIETDSIQKVEVSTSSNYNDRDWLPVTGCVVYVEDDNGNVFNYEESEDGIYTCHIEEQYIQVGVSYRLVVNTSDGDVYSSEYDKMVECPDIDSLYYAIEEDVVGVEEQEVVQGAQFYVNVKREGEQARYCRWSMVETWMYKAYYENNAMLNNEVITMFDESVFVPICYMTEKVTTVHTAQIETQLKPVEINYVSNQTPRLYYKYSLLVRQFGISEGAYTFWSALKSQFEDAGDLYEAQPQSIISNIKNENDEDEIVLGYFNTATVKEKRIFAKRDWTIYVVDYCDYEVLPDDHSEWPTSAYLYVDTYSPDIIMSQDSACFDCTARGGTSVAPDFWED